MQPNRPDNPALDTWQKLRVDSAAARRWDWCALLRLVQAAYPDRKAIGFETNPEREYLRLGQRPHLNVPPVEIADVAVEGPAERGNPAAARTQKDFLWSFHFGMFGPRGPLPLHLTELALHLQREDDRALSAFCDLFHHRFQSFFFRAWAAGRREVDWDRRMGAGASSETPSECDRFVASLLGFGLESMRSADRVSDEAKIYYSGRLIQRPRNCSGIEAILTDFFGVQFKVRPFLQRRVEIPQQAQWRLGEPSEVNGRLGFTTVVGTHIIDHQSAFRIRVGPVNFEQFCKLLPGSSGFERLHDWVLFYFGLQTEGNRDANLLPAWDVRLVLDRSEVPSFRLNGSAKLGWTSWMFGEPPRSVSAVPYDEELPSAQKRHRYVDDLILSPSVTKAE